MHHIWFLLWRRYASTSCLSWDDHLTRYSPIRLDASHNPASWHSGGARVSVLLRATAAGCRRLNKCRFRLGIAYACAGLLFLRCHHIITLLTQPRCSWASR
jgi:hypothetical protein